MKTRVLAVAAALVLAGCGSVAADDPVDSPTTTLSGQKSPPPMRSGQPTPTGGSSTSPSSGGDTPGTSTSSTKKKDPSGTGGGGSKTTGSNPVPKCTKAPGGQQEGKATQVIVFPDFGAQMWPQNSVKLKACASSDLPITYTFVDKFACALSSNVLSIAQPGRCTIRATQPGNGSYAPAAPVTREFVVDPQVVSASWVNPPGSVTVGQKVVLELRVTSPSGPVTHGYINVVAYGDGDLCSGRMESRASSDGIARLDLQTVSSGTCTVTGSVNADAYVHGTNVTALSIKVVDGSSTP